MAQHDYDIANQNGAAFRADLNAVLAATQSMNSGPTEPASTVAYMPWADTTAGLWKVRNAADSAWVSVMSLTASRVDTATGTSYDNSGSDLSATTVKGALDEISSAITGGYTRSNILGTVSQSGGVPTGAIIEYGSNANGEFVRFADGACICTFSTTSNNSGEVTWVFPSQFSINPRISGSVISADTVLRGFRPASISPTQIAFSVISTSGTRLTATTNLIAIGRWF